METKIVFGFVFKSTSPYLLLFSAAPVALYRKQIRDVNYVRHQEFQMRSRGIACRVHIEYRSEARALAQGNLLDWMRRHSDPVFVIRVF